MGIDKCRLEFLLSLKVVMLKRLEFHKEELYATLSQLMPLSETAGLSPTEAHSRVTHRHLKNVPDGAALEPGKKPSSAPGLQIRSQQKNTGTRSRDNSFEGFLWNLRVVTITHGNIYQHSRTRTDTAPWREWLKEIVCNFGPHGETFLVRVARQREGNTYHSCLKHGLNLILSSVTEN